MLTMTPETMRFFKSLTAELAWLENTHPDKVALIASARAQINTMKLAAGAKSPDEAEHIILKAQAAPLSFG